ncbi:MerR family transcriptional regulator [Novosphingobium subterraneum]|uniref:MerR family transcriptional regulator n=1 Tax=Novosphingobium subterraneum TaxID=48936 RepID=A0A0B9AIV0_9SPHN|nr:MerR family transcriptional regulator [Novosphingobium subterraneum]KHS49248.1 MerR family transcriptional regulator [Novosphingobium subterraneum]
MSVPELPDAGPIPDDGKDPAAFRTIGEVAKALGIRQHVLRYWEEQFPTLRPLTRAGGRRYYRPEDVALITEIHRLLHKEGFTIKGARQALRGRKKGVVSVAVPSLEPAPHSSDEQSAAPLLAYLKSIRDRLAAALEE